MLIAGFVPAIPLSAGATSPGAERSTDSAIAAPGATAAQAAPAPSSCANLRREKTMLVFVMTISFLSYEWRNFQEANGAVDWIPMIANFSLMNGGKYIQRRLDWRDIFRLAIYSRTETRKGPNVHRERGWLHCWHTD